MTTMRPQKYTKRPVTIEAMQLTNDPHVASAVATWCGGMGIASPGRVSLHIQTLEGVMVAQPGDFIIKGVQGEFYPCKPDIFAATYDTPTETSKETPDE